MRLAFRRALGVNPRGYRGRFHTTILGSGREEHA